MCFRMKRGDVSTRNGGQLPAGFIGDTGFGGQATQQNQHAKPPLTVEREGRERSQHGEERHSIEKPSLHGHFIIERVKPTLWRAHWRDVRPSASLPYSNSQGRNRCRCSTMSTRLPRKRTPSISNRMRCSRPASNFSLISPPTPTTRCHGKEFPAPRSNCATWR